MLLLLALPLGSGEDAKAQERETQGGIEIEYPWSQEVVREDVVPLWLLSKDPELFERMTVELNGTDITGRLRPWGGRGTVRQDLPEEALTWIRPRPGPNHVSVKYPAEDGSEVERSITFRHEPHAMSVSLRVLEGERDVPARVSFHGLGETPDPPLDSEIWREMRLESAASPVRKVGAPRANFVYTEGQPLELHLPSGRYAVLASRGPAYSMARGEVGPGSGELALRIERVVDTRGWISADFHVHAIPSGDSSVPLWDRVVAFRAHDVDVIVASDHHTITDYQRDLDPDPDWPPGFAAIPGVESGTRRSEGVRGHWNFWPLEREARSEDWAPSGGRAHGGFRPNTIAHPSALYAHFEKLNAEARRQRFGDFPVIVQLNHPRGIQFGPTPAQGLHHAYLSSVDYQPERPLAAAANGRLLERPEPGLPRPIDVDAVELLNRLAYGIHPIVRRDWFAWISQGHVPAAMANSDTHGRVIDEPGFPRNWVRYRGPLPVRAEGLAAAVRARNLVGSTGPLISLEPWSDAGEPIRGRVERLGVTVRGPAWMPLEEVRVYVNGVLTATRRLPAGPQDPFARVQQVHRVEVPLETKGDSFVVVEAGDRAERLLSPQPHAGPMGQAFPRLRVLAFTNPLLVDADADGSPWDRRD